MMYYQSTWCCCVVEERERETHREVMKTPFLLTGTAGDKQTSTRVSTRYSKHRLCSAVWSTCGPRSCLAIVHRVLLLPGPRFILRGSQTDGAALAHFLQLLSDSLHSPSTSIIIYSIFPPFPSPWSPHLALPALSVCS